MIEIAFREWAAVILALGEGRQDILLRKGGIAEGGAGFTVEHPRFLLFPTYFHQQAEGLRPEHRDLVAIAMADRPPPETLRIRFGAAVRSVEVAADEEDLARLRPRHVYADHVVEDKLHGRFGAQLWVMHVELFRLDAPLELPMHPEYGGCRSWVNLDLAKR